MGFSLIELVLALGILSVGLVGALRVFPVGLRASQRTERRSRAAIVAQRTLESLKVTPWAELTEGSTVVETDGLTVTTQIHPPDTLIALVDPTTLKVVEVTVHSPQADERRELTVITYLRENP